MKARYEDILEIATLAGRVPQWWDENGTPRFVAHHPSYCPNTMAKEVVLLEVKCQDCGHVMTVQVSDNLMDRVRASMTNRPYVVLADRVRADSIDYYDPPSHLGSEARPCSAGYTMNSIPVRVLEFWQRPKFEWERVRELEIAFAQ